jgi:multiple sugar transport system substrate-binding protein
MVKPNRRASSSKSTTRNVTLNIVLADGKVGFIPTVPVSEVGTLYSHFLHPPVTMGGWLLAIPQRPNNKDLGWELLKYLVDPAILAAMLRENGNLPTQKPLDKFLEKSVPYYHEMISMVSRGRKRPNLPQFPEITEQIKRAIDKVYYDAA